MKVIVSSTYYFQKLSCSFRTGTRDLSKCTMNIPARTGPRGEPIATPSVCKYMTTLNVKCTFFVQSVSISFISDLVISVESSPLS